MGKVEKLFLVQKQLVFTDMTNPNIELGSMIHRRLKQAYNIDSERFIATKIRRVNLFEFIVAVILSQNTNDYNAIKAYERLRSLCGGEITAKKILELSDEDIMSSIKIAGMYRQRTKKIKELAVIFNTRSIETLVRDIERLDVENARKMLMKMPGIGAKTADVVLLMYFSKPTFPVDTHIARITRRLGYLSKYDYETIRKWWMTILKPEQYLETHLLLITHGRNVCKAIKPLCHKCVIINLCNLGKKIMGSG